LNEPMLIPAIPLCANHPEVIPVPDTARSSVNGAQVLPLNRFSSQIQLGRGRTRKAVYCEIGVGITSSKAVDYGNGPRLRCPPSNQFNDQSPSPKLCPPCAVCNIVMDGHCDEDVDVITIDELDVIYEAWASRFRRSVENSQCLARLTRAGFDG